MARAVLFVVAVAAVCPALALPGSDLLLGRLPREVDVAPSAVTSSDSLPVQDEMFSIDISPEEAARKKKNATVGEEILTTVIEGFAGEGDEDSLGDDIVSLISAFTNLGGKKKKKKKGQYESRGVVVCEDCEPAVGAALEAPVRVARAADLAEGRKHQVRRLLVRYIVLLKVVALGIILPGAVLMSLLQSWKAVTLSLLALLLAAVVGIRGLVSNAGKGQEVIHAGPSSHYWRRVSQEHQPDADRLAYSAYSPY